jgi:hypothetical protein
MLEFRVKCLQVSFEVGYRITGPPRPICEAAAAAGMTHTPFESIEGVLAAIGADEPVRLLHQKVYVIVRAFQDEWQWSEV